MIFIHPVVLGAFLSGVISPLAVADTPTKARHAPETPDQIFLRVWPSVVAVDMVDAGGNRIGPGSGVLFDDQGRLIGILSPVYRRSASHFRTTSGLDKRIGKGGTDRIGANKRKRPKLA
jgi:hypothetical protein